MTRGQTIARVGLTAALGAAGLTGTAFVASPAAHAACDSWPNSTMAQGSTGPAVTELQIRVAGWVPSGQRMATDGKFGPMTTTAVKRFQSSYGLTPDGRVGPATRAKLRSLTKSDCTPLHFTYAQASNNCGKGFTGTAAQKANLRRSIWQAEALRRQLGDRPLTVHSGFRDSRCNAQSGGDPNSSHLTGMALDLSYSGVNDSLAQFCQIAKQARSAGFTTIYGPGYPNHNDHIHVGWNNPSKNWQAPRCGAL